jgi:hypothetical protein
MVAMLKASGVRRVYGIPGDSLNGFTDALRRDGAVADPNWCAVRRLRYFAAVQGSSIMGSDVRFYGFDLGGAMGIRIPDLLHAMQVFDH